MYKIAPDITKQIEIKFGLKANDAKEMIDSFVVENDFPDDRLIRGIIFLSGGDLDGLEEMMFLAEDDEDHIFLVAEYEFTDIKQRDLSKPFSFKLELL